MTIDKYIKRIFFICVFLSLSGTIFYRILHPLYQAKEVIIDYGLEPYNITIQNPYIWIKLKKLYIIVFIISNVIYGNILYSQIKFLYKKQCKKKDDSLKGAMKLLIGKDANDGTDIFLPESGLYQNFLITGTIGSGKTSSVMYPLTEQLISYNDFHRNKKIGMLILDVKGNYYKQVRKLASEHELLMDLVVIELGGKIRYNPLHKPYLKPSILANRLRTILELFSENNSESYWLDKAEQVLTEAIKLCRLYNDGYVTFTEIHKIVTEEDYYKNKISILKDLFVSGKLSDKQIYELNSALEFFQKEFERLDSRTLNILKSEITRITNVFVSDYDVSRVFCPKKEELNFRGFDHLIAKGKIVVLNMNVAEYRNLSKIMAAYLKLDFQTEVMKRLSYGKQKTTAFICDEYAEYVTKTDSEFFALSREAKCINIVSVQSYSSIKNTLKDETSVKVICQNLINKIWFRTDDLFTIEEAQKQLGKEDKVKTSKNISENAKETNYNFITRSWKSHNSSLSESVSVYTQNDYVYDTNYFTVELETFFALAFLTNGHKMMKPRRLKMIPYFKKENVRD